MNKRILKKLKNMGVDLTTKPNPKNWTRGYFVGESILRDYYLEIKKMDPRNPILNYLVLDEANHVTILPEFAKERWPNQDYSKPSEFILKLYQNMKKTVPIEPIIVLTLKGELSEQYQILKNLKSAEEQKTSKLEIKLIS